jgi:hypothetical protein
MDNDLNGTLTALGAAEAAPALSTWWDAAMGAAPPDIAGVLAGGDLQARRRALALDDDADPVIEAAAAAVHEDPDLARFAWYLHWRTFIAPRHGCAWGVPDLPGRYATLSGGLYLLLALEFAPRLQALHRSRGYPEAVTSETVQEARCFDANHRIGTGRPGIYARQFPWFASYLVDDPYVRLGRLEFQLHAWGGGGVTVWRRDDGLQVALADDGLEVGVDGLRVRGSGAFRTRLEEDDGQVCGHPVEPAGRILPWRTRLSRSRWSPLLRRGDTVLDVHIPAGGRMDWASCQDSFRRAHAFFPAHHAGRPARAAVCSTWFLDPRLAELLPAEANPLQLARAVHLFPVHPDPEALWFVFQRPTPPGVDVATLPQDTGLRRALAGFLARGLSWNCGGMFALWDDLPQLRDGLYREVWQAVHAVLDRA